jgi:penicillin-binding protein 1C
MYIKLNRYVLGICVIFVVLASVAVLDYLCPPDLTRIHEVSKELHSEAGDLLHVIQTRDEKWRLKADLDRVDPAYINMLVAREDRYFWQHIGVNPASFVRAAYQLLTHGRVVSGGSTLTMQVARLLEPRPRTITAKLIQIFRALQLERRYSKREILEFYMTLAPYGSNLEGTRSAAYAYFGKSADKLLPSETALLVALPQTPSLWQRDGFTRQTLHARNRVLTQAFESGLLDESTYHVSLKDSLPDYRFSMPREMPHVARRLLGTSQSPAIATCTIRPALQARLEQLARSAVRVLPPEVNIAIMVVHHPSRQIISYVGSSDFYNASRQGQVDFIRSYRSPGSTLKPFIYGLGFDYGYITPSTYVLDDRRRYGTYMPENFDKTFYGMVTISDALANSLNVPAVDLLHDIGPQRFLGTLEQVGVSPKFADNKTAPGLSVALGGLGMTLEQLVTLYASLPQQGQTLPLSLTNGAIAEQPLQLLSARSADQLTEILSQTLFNELGEANSGLAVKTGTSYGYRDAWAMGYNDEYVVGIWIGRPDGAPFGVGTGRTLAVPVLQQVFRSLPAAKHLEHRRIKKDALQLNDFTNVSHTKSKKLLKQSPQMLFPVDGTVIENFHEDDPSPLIFSALGGQRPYTWLVDGIPVATNVWQPKTPWKPEKPGFYRVSLLDAQGLSQTANVEVQ